MNSTWSILGKLSAAIFILLLNAHAGAQIFIQAEDYSSMSGIQTEGCTDEGGGINVGWIDNNDWLEYGVSIPIAGEYIFRFRMASLNGGGSLSIAIEGNSLANVSMIQTGGWQTWVNIESTAVSLSAGGQTIRLRASSGGFNLNWFEIELTDPVDNDQPSSPVIKDSIADVHTICIDWSASSDLSSAIAGYKIYKQGSFLASTGDSSYCFSKLPPETTLNLDIYACDLAGNLSEPATISISTIAPNWELAWSDEFDGTEVDRSKWNFQTGGGGWGNGEAQYYTDGDNSSVADGYLTIEARKENYGGNQFTSSRMNTAGKGDFLYGRAEVRAKLPSTGGTWPAIWTLPTEWSYGGWPDCGEIDIMEHAANNLGYVFGTVHTGAYNHGDGTQKGGGVWWPDVADSFHVYALEWYPDHLDWYYDDQLVFTFDNEYKSFEEWPYDIEHHILLNVAIGGGLGGNINYNGAWPQQMVVDYVRIYNFDFESGDTIAPTPVSDLQAVASGINIDLTWTRSEDDKFIEKYYIFKDDVLIDSVSSTAYGVNYLDPLTSYTFSIQASDFAGNLSEKVSVQASTEDISHLPIPGKIEAEDFLYMYGIQTETCSDAGGGLNLGYIDPGDWMEYSVDVVGSGKYFMAVRTASLIGGGSFELYDENDVLLTTIATPATGGWQNWRTVVSDGFMLNEGMQRLLFVSLDQEYNLNWFDITTDSSKHAVSTEKISLNTGSIYPNPYSGQSLNIELDKPDERVEICIYTVDGRKVYSDVFKAVQNTITLSGVNLKPGSYLVTVRTNEGSAVYKLFSRQRH